MASLYPDTSMVIRMCLAVVSSAKVAKSGLENLESRTSTFVEP